MTRLKFLAGLTGLVMTLSRLIPLHEDHTDATNQTILNLPTLSNNAWMYYDLCLTLSLVLVLIMLADQIAYKQLKIKCLFAYFAIASIIDFVTLALSHIFYSDILAWSYVVQIIAVFPVVFFYAFRRYSEPSDPLETDYLFCLRKKPAGVQDFAISMLGSFGSGGAYSLLANDKVYAFRNGRVMKYDITHLRQDDYHITRGARLTPAILDELENTLGTKWTLRSNCVTLLGSIWRRNRYVT
jgi:hypothetical protein